jgi:hypothetical protein
MCSCLQRREPNDSTGAAAWRPCDRPSSPISINSLMWTTSSASAPARYYGLTGLGRRRYAKPRNTQSRDPLYGSAPAPLQCWRNNATGDTFRPQLRLVFDDVSQTVLKPGLRKAIMHGPVDLQAAARNLNLRPRLWLARYFRRKDPLSSGCVVIVEYVSDTVESGRDQSDAI